MNEKTIFKFNSLKSIRPAAWLALTILAVGAFGNSLRAEVWLNETFEQYTVASPATAPTAVLSPLLQQISSGSTVVGTAGNQMCRYFKPSATALAVAGLQYSLSPTNATPRPRGYISFKVVQNTPPSPVIASSDFSLRLGSNDSTTMGGSASAFIDVRFTPSTTATCLFSVRSGNNVQTVITTVSATAQSTIKIWYNSENVGMAYTDPSGNAQTLSAASYVCYVNNALASSSASGTALLGTVTTSASSVVPPVTSSVIGKLAFQCASSKAVDFSVDDIYAADSAPVSGVGITSPTTATAQAGYPFSYQITSSGVTSPDYNTSTLPSGLSLNRSTGVISGTVDLQTAADTLPITLTATPATGTAANGSLLLTITAAPGFPTIDSTATTSGKVTEPFSYQIVASGSGGPITSYTATPLPAGLSLNSTTGVISGTPNATGVTDVICTATNPRGTTSSTQTLTITINAAPIATWNGTGTLWNSGSSWNPQAVPSSLDTAIFANLGSRNDVDVGTGQTIAGIVFNPDAKSYMWTGTEITVASAGGITNKSTATQTFGNKVINSGSGNTTWSVEGGSLVFSGGIDLTQAGSSASRTLTFAGAGNVSVNSVIANGGTATSGAVTVTNTGTTILSGSNTYDGLTRMNNAAGTLTLSGDNSEAIGGVTLTAGTLNINNNKALGTGPITFATGTTINNTSGAAVVNAGNQNWTWSDLLTFGSSTNTATNNLNLGTGVVTASSGRTIALAGTGTKLTMGRVNITSESSGRTLIANNTNGTGNTLEMGGLTLSANTSNAVVVDLLGSANINVTGPIENGSAFAHGVNVGATGTNTFSGTNTYTGPTTISAGTLILSGSNASSGYTLTGYTNDVYPVLKVNELNALSPSATVMGSSSSAKTGTLEFARAGNYTLNQYLGQNMNFSNSSGSAATLIFTNATSYLGTTLSGKTFANKSANLTITFSGEVDISGAENSTNTISTIGPVVISNRVFNSNTSFTRTLLKLETNSLTMYGVNSYSGTIVSRGTLVIPTGGSLTNCGTTVVAGTSASAGNSASLNLAGAAGVVQVGTNGFVRGDGPITSLQVQEAGAVEVAVGTTWTTRGTIDFAAGSKVSVTGTPAMGNTYTLMTASTNITGSPILVSTNAAGWVLKVDEANPANLLLVESDTYNIGVGESTTFSDIITGTAPLVKKGLGTAIITGNNDFTGGTILQAGTLQIENVNGLGTGAVTLTSGTLKSTVNLDLARLIPAVITVGLGNQLFQDTYGALALLKYTGNNTTINGAVTLDVASATTMTMLTLAGNSSADSLVTKIGAGTVKLMGGTSTTVFGGWRIQAGTVWFTPSANNGGGTGPITLAGGNAKFSKLQNSNGTYTGYDVPSDLMVESDGVIQYDPAPSTLLGQNNLGFNNLNIGARTLEVATATSSTVVGQGLPSVNFKSATLTGSAIFKNLENLVLSLQAVSGTGGLTKTGAGTLYLSDQPNQAAAFAKLNNNMTVDSITVEYAGSGYTVAPEVTLVGGGGTGTGTTATATIDNKGRVTSIAVNTAGSVYTSLPRVVIAAPPTVATGNSYTGATTVQEGKLNLNGNYASSVTVKPGAALQLDCPAPALARCSIDAVSSASSGYLTDAANAYVKGLYLTKSVKGYVPNSTLTLTIDAPRKTDGTTLVPGGVAATATATVNSDGVISALTIQTGGSGYVISPRVTVPAPTVPTVVARTTRSITFEAGARLALNIASPTSASYTLFTADEGITGTPELETPIDGYSLVIEGNSLKLKQTSTSDTTPPVITVVGADPLTVAQGSVYSDAGATTDDGSVVRANIPDSITSTVGSKTVTYDSVDASGNNATQKTRTVIVTDQTAPLLVLNGANPLSVTWGGVFTDPGASFTDNVDASKTVTSLDTVDTSRVGSTTLTYSAVDAGGNAAVNVTRTVTVTLADGGTTVGADGLSDLMRYALGGTGPSSKVELPTVAVTSTTLTMSALIRIDDLKVSVVGIYGLAPGTWVTGSPITGVPSSSQTGAVAGVTQRQDFSVPRGTDSKKFMYLKATLTP